MYLVLGTMPLMPSPDVASQTTHPQSPVCMHLYLRKNTTYHPSACAFAEAHSYSAVNALNDIDGAAKAVTITRIKDAANHDQTYCELLQLSQSGFPRDFSQLTNTLTAFLEDSQRPLYCRQPADVWQSSCDSCITQKGSAGMLTRCTSGSSRYESTCCYLCLLARHISGHIQPSDPVPHMQHNSTITSQTFPAPTTSSCLPFRTSGGRLLYPPWT